MVHIDPDVAKVFPDEKAINEALRTIIHIRNAENITPVRKRKRSA